MSEVTNTARHNNLVYDVGMHKGEDTDYYLKKGFNVIGFEADPALVDHCKTRFSTELQNGRLILVEGAIVQSPSEGATVTFFRNRDNSAWGTALPSWAGRNELLGAPSETIEVAAVDFSKCLLQYGVPHYLKIDIEGMDTVCLRSLRPLEQKPAYVSIESEKVSFRNLVDELNLFRQLGYTGFKAIQQAGVGQIAAQQPGGGNRLVNHHFIEGSSGRFGADLPYKWKTYNEILNEYKLIFLQYKLFGDSGAMNHMFVGKLLKKGLSVLLHRPIIPGWYDTHAKHSSVAV